jgi:hypothetical protein
MTLGEQIDKVIDSLPPVTKIVIAAMLLIQAIAFGTWLGRTFCSCQCGIFTVLYANSSVAHSLDNPTSAIISLMNEKNSIFTQQQPSRHPLPQPPLPPLRQLLHRHPQHHHLASPNIHPCHHLIS